MNVNTWNHIGLKDSRHLFIQSEVKPNCDALARFSRALRQPHVITSSFDWFNVLSVSYVIGQSNYFGFGFTTLKRKPLYWSAIHNKSYEGEKLTPLFILRRNWWKLSLDSVCNCWSQFSPRSKAVNLNSKCCPIRGSSAKLKQWENI